MKAGNLISFLLYEYMFTKGKEELKAECIYFAGLASFKIKNN